MKKTFKLFAALLIFVFAINVVKAQVPTYTLTATNFLLTSPNPGDSDNVLCFDIYILNTSPGAFEYAGGQYFLSFNDRIKLGPDGACPTATLTYSILGSDLPTTMQPRTPSIAAVSGVSMMRLAVNTFPGAGAGFPISNVFPGTKIVRMCLRTSCKAFSHSPLDTANIRWRNPPTSVTQNPVTKIFAYIPPFGTGGVNTEIEPSPQPTPPTHIIGPYPNPLPVELLNFTANVNRNAVILNWATVSETDNAGFDIERRLSSASDWSKIGNISGNGTTSESKSYAFTDRITSGKYNYRLKQIDFNGNYTYHALSGDIEVGVPKNFNMSQNYPNPFNPTTKIDYDLPLDGKVTIVLYDISGREVANLVNEVKTAGYYTVQFNASNLASGMYFYRISATNFVSTKKMVLIK